MRKLKSTSLTAARLATTFGRHRGTMGDSMKTIVTALAMVLPCIAALGAQQRDEAQDNEVAPLIAKLASRNPRPTERHGPDLKYPPGYARNKQKSVREAMGKLTARGTKAFRELIDSWGDDRYSLTYSVGINGYMKNATVGRVCRIIVYDQIQPYGFWPRRDDDARGKPKRPSYPDTFLGDADSAHEWLERHKDKSLYDLQLMVLDWIIGEEAKRPGDFTDVERKELSELRKTLIENKTPISGGNYYMDDYD